jgi:hypothetical protein
MVARVTAARPRLKVRVSFSSASAAHSGRLLRWPLRLRGLRVPARLSNYADSGDGYRAQLIGAGAAGGVPGRPHRGHQGLPRSVPVLHLHLEDLALQSAATTRLRSVGPLVVLPAAQVWAFLMDFVEGILPAFRRPAGSAAIHPRCA